MTGGQDMSATRKDYAVFQEMATRWRDNDVYGHMNNAVFYEYVDTAVNHCSVTYEVALFRGQADEAAAVASFTHVYVDKATHRPKPLEDRFRAALQALVVA